MNANELRIGNILNGGIVVQSIDDCGVNTGMQNSCLLSNLHPIPLTPEILEKCGFEKWKDNKTFSIENEAGEKIQIRDDEFFIGGRDSCTEGMGYHGEIKYLYQLQNLIFILTGKELEINLNEKALS